jgi:SpoVK/Ycf46/Vps4 family AAA+-type ATPase
VRGDTYVRCSEEHRDIVEDLKRFLQAEGLYRQLGLSYRRGFLLYGPPGNGKTALLRDVLRSHLPGDAVVLYCARVPSVRFLQGINGTLMNRTKVFIFEELYSVISSNNCGDILGFLDGEYSTERCITFATTNHPERLPGSLINRPSRFDRYIPIGNPDEEARFALIRHLIGREPVQQELRETSNFSFADIREICLTSLLHSRTISASVAEHHLHRERIKQDFSDRQPIGL